MKHILIIIALALALCGQAGAAEILVKAVDAVNSNPTKDRGCYKRGMPVVIMDDGYKWGSSECPPLFFIVKVPGVPKEKMQKYIEAWNDTTFIAQNPFVMHKRRIWTIKIDDMGKPVTDALTAKGTLSVNAVDASKVGHDFTWDEFQKYFVNQITNEPGKENPLTAVVKQDAEVVK
jgi:hypothetical protein